MSKKSKKPIETIEVRERPIKSLIKTITYRIFAFIAMFFVALVFFKDDKYALEKATGVAAGEALVKMVLYYLHERLWNNIRWGKMRVYVRHYNILWRRVIKKKKISPKSPKD